LLAACALLGCASAQRRADVPRYAAARLDVVDLAQPLRAVERAPDGTLRVVWGGLRAELSGDDVALGDDAFREPVVGAVRAERGWVFAAADGAAARSDTFAGPLRALPPLDEPTTLGGRHVATAVNADGAVLTSDGAGAFGPTPSQPPAPAASALFDGPLRGAAVLLTGEVYATADGGATWRHAGASAPRAGLRVDAEGLFLAPLFEREPRGFLPDGRIGPPASRPPEALTVTLTDAERASVENRIRQALRRRNPGFLWRTGYTRLPDGGALVDEPEGVVELAPDGSRRALHAGAVTLATLARARHGGELAGYESYSADLAVAASVVPTGFDAPPRLRLGRVGGRVREVVLSQRVASIAGLTADRAWGWRDDEGRRVPVRVDLASGAVDDRPAPDRGCDDDTCAFTPDGALLVLDRGRLTRDAFENCEEVALPEGASRIAFHDDQRGMAYGERVDRVWLTQDGGRRWAQVETHAPAGYVGARASCHAGGCSVGGVTIEGWDAARLRSRVVESSAPRPTPADPWVAPWAERAPRVACDYVGRGIAPPPWTRPTALATSAGSSTGVVRRVVREATPQDGAAGHGGRAWSVEWRGVDASGAFHGASPWRVERHGEAEGRLTVLSLTRDHVDFVRETARLLFGVPRGEGWRASPSALERWRSFEFDRVDNVWASPTGACADVTRWRPERWIDPQERLRPANAEATIHTVQERLLVADDGPRGVVGRVLHDATEVTFAERGGVHGAVHWAHREPGRARFVPADERLPGETVTLPVHPSFTVCVGAPPTNALHVAAQARVDRSEGPLPSFIHAFVTLEFDGDRACVRAADGNGPSRVWAVGGTLEGGPIGSGAEPSERFRCALTAPAR